MRILFSYRGGSSLNAFIVGASVTVRDHGMVRAGLEHGLLFDTVSMHDFAGRTISLSQHMQPGRKMHRSSTPYLHDSARAPG